MGKVIILCAIFLMAAFFFKLKHRGDYTHRDATHHYNHKIGHKHGEGYSIDFYAYASKIRHWNATFKVSLSVLILILCIVLDNPYVSVAAFIIFLILL